MTATKHISSSCKGILIDYGATIDTRGEHWSKVIWRAYKKAKIPITREQFLEAYIATERKLGQGDIIKPTDTFRTTLCKKIALQLEYLNGKGQGKGCSEDAGTKLADALYTETMQVIEESREVLQKIQDTLHCPMVLVSNFYGNIHTVLQEFRLRDFFVEVIESAEVGIRKPDPRIWQLAIDAVKRACNTEVRTSEIVVIGDSLEKDILPAQALGCKTIQIKNGLKEDITI